MATDGEERSKQDLEEEVWAAISAFEQILEAMPDDRASLEALSNAYQQIGDHVRAKDYYLRLGRLLLREADAVAALDVVEPLRAYAAADGDVRRLIEDLERMGSGGEAAPAAVPAVEKPAVSTDFNMAEELSFTWNLLQNGEITQEEYAGIVQDLTEMSASDATATVSVLHALEGRGFKNLERIIAFVARHAETPYVALSGFDLQPAATGLLAPEFMLRRGALSFALLGRDALVAVLNPYDQKLRRDVAALAGRPCHFYLTRASEFDLALNKITGVETKKSPVSAGG